MVLKQLRWDNPLNFSIEAEVNQMAIEGSFCGTGGWTGPLPGDPDNNVIISATPAFGGIDVSWTYPLTNPFAVAHTLLYRGYTPNFIAAMQIQVVSGSSFYDKIDNGSAHYYWIKLVSVNGTVGELIGPATAVARPMITDLIQQLTGKIDSGLLATSLKAKLDDISLINTNLASEIFDRQGGETSLAQAMQAVSAGNAEAHTFILNEANSRVASDAVIAQQIQGVVATLGNDIAAAVVTAGAWVNPVNTLNNKVTAIGALYTVKLTVNGLIGGLGVYNDGSTVQAGFDVDQFWVGRTNANQRKPFMVIGEETFIDEAVINTVTINKLRTASGGVVIQDGLIRADAVNLDYAGITGATRPQNGATRNVYRGNWAVSTLYEIGDNVLDGGYGWSAISAQSSTAVIRPPTYPTTANSYWALSTVKGSDGTNGSFDPAARAVLAGSGGVVAGSLTWDASTGARTTGSGVAMTGHGIVAHNGVNYTFILNSGTGAASFAGDLSAATGTFKGMVNVGDFTGFTWPAAGGTGAHLSSQGLLLGNYTAGPGNPGGKYLQISTPAGGVPSISTNIPAYIESAQIGTAQIAGNAVTFTVAAFTAGTSAISANGATTVQSVSLTTSGGKVLIWAGGSCDASADSGVSTSASISGTYTLQRGLSSTYTTIATLSSGSSSVGADSGGVNFGGQGGVIVDTSPGSGAYTYRLLFTCSSSGLNLSAKAHNIGLAVLEIKR